MYVTLLLKGRNMVSNESTVIPEIGFDVTAVFKRTVVLFYRTEKGFMRA